MADTETRFPWLIKGEAVAILSKGLSSDDDVTWELVMSVGKKYAVTENTRGRRTRFTLEATGVTMPRQTGWTDAYRRAPELYPCDHPKIRAATRTRKIRLISRTLNTAMEKGTLDGTDISVLAFQAANIRAAAERALRALAEIEEADQLAAQEAQQ